MAVDGFELAYDRTGSGPAVVLLHGWPGDRTDYRALVPLLRGCEVVAPDLRGFGASGKHLADPTAQYDATAQARSVAALITDLGLERPVVAGYDIGSRIAQALASARPELVKALVITPPVPGVGTRVFGAGPMREFWYQSFHRLAPRRRAHRRQAQRGPRVPAALLGALVRTRLRAGGGGPRPPCLRLRAARSVHRVGQLVPVRGRNGRASAVRDGTGPRRPARDAGHRPVARARPALPPGLVGPARRVLRPGAAALRRRCRPLRAPGVPGRAGRGNPGGRGRLSRSSITCSRPAAGISSTLPGARDAADWYGRRLLA